MAWKRLKRHEEREGRIALPPDDEEAAQGNGNADYEATANVWADQERC